MKLVELLARELKMWPEEATHAVQGDDGIARFTEGGKPGLRDEGYWSVLAKAADEHSYWLNDELKAELATDHATAIVNRAEWEAEVARLARLVEHGPLQWRDRIREIDITVEALEEERAGLMQQLEDEGFRLINQEVKPSTKPRSEWAVGDLVVRVEKTDESSMPIHIPMPITYFDGTNRGQDVCVDGEFYPMVSTLRWHSRPSA